MNYLAIKAKHTPTHDVGKYLTKYLVTGTNEGQLYVWESNFTPMWARDQFGANCVHDLLEEVAIQSFLGTIPAADFYLKRAGEECGTRGEWEKHPFAGHEEVISIQVEYEAELRPVDEPRVLVVVSGGVADPVWDDGVDVVIFDWDNYKEDPTGTGGVPARFVDLATPLDIPVENQMEQPQG